MSTTPDTTTSGGSANANHQASDKGKVASKNAWRRQKTKHLSTANETMTMNFEGKCDDLSGYIYDCADPKQAADMYTNTTKEISEYVGRTYKYGGEMRQVIMKLRKPTYPIPEDIPKDSSARWSEDHLEEQANRIREKRIGSHRKRQNSILPHLGAMY
jgi:hypothetical protein